MKLLKNNHFPEVRGKTFSNDHKRSWGCRSPYNCKIERLGLSRLITKLWIIPDFTPCAYNYAQGLITDLSQTIQDLMSWRRRRIVSYVTWSTIWIYVIWNAVMWSSSVSKFGCSSLARHPLLPCVIVALWLCTVHNTCDGEDEEDNNPWFCLEGECRVRNRM